MTLRIPTGREGGCERGHDRDIIGYPGREYKEYKEYKEFKESATSKARICPTKLINPLEFRGLLPFRISILELLELLVLLVTLSSPR
jgi:hypothetical protein